MTAEFILGPYFFEEDNEGALKTVTVNGQRYHHLLLSYVLPKLRELPEEVQSAMIFQQDGAPPHIFTPVKNLLREFFGDRIISRHFPNLWPPRSPDLNPLDYWLWGYLGQRVFQRGPKSILQLKDAIREEISALISDQLRDAVESFSGRVAAVIENDGAHIEHLR